MFYLPLRFAQQLLANSLQLSCTFQMEFAVDYLSASACLYSLIKIPRLKMSLIAVAIVLYSDTRTHTHICTYIV